jgi:hypothetical protein
MEMVHNRKQQKFAERALAMKRTAEQREAEQQEIDKARHSSVRRYLDKRDIGRRYNSHPNSTPRRVKEGTFPSATIWLGPASPRWDTGELDRYDELLALTGDPRKATAQVLAERAQRLAAAA